MTALDILIAVVAAAGFIMGLRSGIISQVGQIAAVIIAIIVCRIFGSDVAAWLGSGDEAADDTFTTIAAYAITFIVAYLAVWLAAYLLRSMIHLVCLGVVDRIAGGVFKAALWLLMLSLALNVYIAVSGDTAMFNNPERPWRTAVVKMAPAALGYLAEVSNSDP